MALVMSALLAASSSAVPADDQAAGTAKSAVRISGQVVRDEGGEPVAGAEVTLLLPAPPGQEYSVWPLPLRNTKSDAHGKFAFDNLPPGKYRV
jgi:protocatechuate 3,4-dioxygenase beta subunit